MMEQLSKAKDWKTRSISPENLTGEPGKGGMTELESGTARMAARDLGTGWKVNPYFDIEPHQTLELANIVGCGAIKHIWMTPTGKWRTSILRIYWDGSDVPSVECPVGDFFCMGWQEFMQISSQAVCVNPGSAFNCYWDMPFKQQARITLENLDDAPVRIYYQIDYALYEQPVEICYFHAQFRRVNPLPYKEVYTILDDVKGKGHYVGTYMAWGSNSNGWWGEGEIKFYLDDDSDHPSICGTGTEDYFCGSYDFEDPQTHARYLPFTTPYTGLQVVEPDRLYKSQFRFGMYRWHLTDPICFEKSLRVTIQALGWFNMGKPDCRYLPLRDDIASVAFWYQTQPAKAMPALPERDLLEVI